MQYVIILSSIAFLFLLLMIFLMLTSPEGYEDETRFYYGKLPKGEGDIYYETFLREDFDLVDFDEAETEIKH